MFLCQCWAFHRSSCKEMVLMDYGGITSHMHIVQAVSFVVIQGMCVCGGGEGGRKISLHVWHTETILCMPQLFIIEYYGAEIPFYYIGSNVYVCVYTYIYI